MAAATLTITIEDLPRRKLLGNWMSLNAAEDQTEYSQLKEAFARRLKTLPGGETWAGYGICSDIRENLDCHYWTAVETSPDHPAPNGMVPICLEAGPYACLSAPEGMTLAEFYDYLRNFWEQSQAIYMVDRHRPCFEFFGQNWAGSVGVKFFVPLKARYRQVSLEAPATASLPA